MYIYIFYTYIYVYNIYIYIYIPLAQQTSSAKHTKQYDNGPQGYSNKGPSASSLAVCRIWLWHPKHFALGLTNMSQWTGSFCEHLPLEDPDIWKYNTNIWRGADFKWTLLQQLSQSVPSTFAFSAPSEALQLRIPSRCFFRF